MTSTVTPILEVTQECEGGQGCAHKAIIRISPDIPTTLQSQAVTEALRAAGWSRPTVNRRGDRAWLCPLAGYGLPPQTMRLEATLDALDEIESRIT